MLGAKLEATFHSGRISAYFTAYLDVIVNWSPIFFEAELGISLRVEARFFLTSLNVTIAASIKMWGPPVGGIAHIDLTVVKFDIEFGEKPPKQLKLIETWQDFCHEFLNLKGGDRRAVKDAVPAFPMIQPNLAAGRNNLNNLPNARRRDSQPKPEDDIWKVRPDEFELAAAATVPVSTLNLGTVKTTDGVPQRDTSGRSMMVTEQIKVENTAPAKKSANKLGAHPMGKGIDSVLNVTMVRDEDKKIEAVKMSGWTIEEETGSLAAAVWQPGKPNMKPTEPTAKLVEGCITGIKRLKPPAGTLGKKAELPPLEWHPLGAFKVVRPKATQKKPVAKGARNVQTLVAKNQGEQQNIVNALSSVGFSLTWKSVSQSDVRFRELQADPLAGEVAALRY